jgi:hypothetical protein
MEVRLYIPVIGKKFDWEWLGYHLTLTCHFPLTRLNFHASGWLFFHGLISFLSALCPYSPLLAGAETRNSSSNLQPGRFSLPWSPGACSISSSVAFPQGDSSLLPLPKKESWGQLLRFQTIIFFTSLLNMGKSLKFKVAPGCPVVLVFLSRLCSVWNFIIITNDGISLMVQWLRF